MIKKNSKNILIRADGSKKIGLGHLSRACLVAQMVQRCFKFGTKVILKDDAAAVYFLKKRGVKTVILPEEVSKAEEMAFLRDIAKREKPEMFITDILQHDIDPAYMKNINAFGCPIISITDDSYRRVINADLVINGNPCQQGQEYTKERGRYLLGPKYFLMDPAYAQIKISKPLNPPQKVFMTFGGSDHNDLLFRALKALESAKAALSVVLVASRATGYIDRLKKYLKQSSLKAELFVDVDSLVPYWSKCDLAITAGGNTLFERIAARVPGATLCQLERQMEIAERFQQMGVNFNLGFGPDISDDILCDRIRDFIGRAQEHAAQYERSPSVVDGRGLDRLEDEIKPLLEEKVYELRSA